MAAGAHFQRAARRAGPRAALEGTALSPVHLAATTAVKDPSRRAGASAPPAPTLNVPVAASRPPAGELRPALSVHTSSSSRRAAAGRVDRWRMGWPRARAWAALQPRADYEASGRPRRAGAGRCDAFDQHRGCEAARRGLLKGAGDAWTRAQPRRPASGSPGRWSRDFQPRRGGDPRRLEVFARSRGRRLRPLARENGERACS